MVTSSGDFVVLAIQRKGHDQEGNIELAVGDTLLLQGTWTDLDQSLDESEEVLVVDSPELVRRQAVPMGPGARRAIATLIAMVVLLASGAVPAFVAALLAACAMVLLGVLTVNHQPASFTPQIATSGHTRVPSARSGSADQPVARQAQSS